MGNRFSIVVASPMLATVLVAFFFASAPMPANSAPNPIRVESREVESRDVSSLGVPSDSAVSTNTVPVNAATNVYSDEVVPFRPPIEDESTAFGEISSSGEMSYQMQILQQEVQTLRGIVEQLEYKLSRLQSTQDDRYLELDQRFQRLSAQPGTAIAPLLNVNEIPNEAPLDPGSQQPATVTLTQDDKTLYDSALELIRGRQYELAISQLRALISQSPDSPLTANAYYWLGEVYSAKPEPDFESARKALAQVITYFPEHRKAPDAAFKLGKVYNLMGECKRAVELLNQVIQQHDGKSVAKVAQTYLREKVGSCS